MVVRVGKFDVTPEILYREGKAVSVKTYCVFNMSDVGMSDIITGSNTIT